MKSEKGLDRELREFWGEDFLAQKNILPALQRAGIVTIPVRLKSRILESCSAQLMSSNESSLFRWAWFATPIAALGLALALLPLNPVPDMLGTPTAIADDYQEIALLAGEFLGDPISNSFEGSDGFELLASDFFLNQEV